MFTFNSSVFAYLTSRSIPIALFLSLSLSLSLSVPFDSQASCNKWLERLRRAIRGAKDLDKTFAFVHWAYSRDQAATPTSQATPPVLNGGPSLLNTDYNG